MWNGGLREEPSVEHHITSYCSEANKMLEMA